MRLLERGSNGEFSLTKDLVNNLPPYAILSHTWGEEDQEVTFQDLTERSGKSKAGYQKIQFCGEQAARDGLQYFWVDTCCIEKSDPVELQKSINSMFRWYKNAVKCYVYLSDVSIPDDKVKSHATIDLESAFRTAKWFTRGWTLQELLAPSSVEFFSADYMWLGDKHSLERLIHQRTRIPAEALQVYDPEKFSIEERVSWAANRETKHEEDTAYSLLGIFGVFLPLIYGEGRENAFRRLREEASKIVKSYEFDKLPKAGIKNQRKFIIPFVRDSKFVGRGDIMKEITNRLEMQHRVALCGIGGIGKSQIAIEFCYTWKYRYPDSHIFWVHASTFDRFEQAYRDIAKELSIPGTEDPQHDPLILVRDWLGKPENGSWLLVLDNVDNLELFFNSNLSATKRNHLLISNFLPRNSNGSMIITTRDTRIGHRLTHQEAVVIVPPLPPLDAEQLLRHRIPSWGHANIENIQDLIEILGFIPLAITQAAAFIQENGFTLKTYLERLKESDSDLQDYLEEDLPDPRRYPDNENSVIRTWKLSFDQITQQRPRAAELLSIMVLLDRQAIPKTLLKQDNERNIEFDKAVGTLQAYSLIKTEKGGTSFEVHRLVQLSTQRWLSLQNRQTEWQEKALELMVRKFPSGEYATWKECESLFLHAKRVTGYNYIHEALLLRRAELLENIARYDKNRGRFEAAYLQYKDALRLKESKLGKTHPSTLTTMSNLAGVLDSQGKHAEAETINRQTLELIEEVLGKTHPSTLTTMGNLAGVLDSQGKYAEAETINRQTLELIEEVLGKTHPSTLTTMGNLAGVLDRQGKYAEAETINRQTLELMEEVLGKTHPSTLTTMSNLAGVLDSQGKYAEAETINRQTLELKEEVLGKTHPSTLTTMSNLARVLNSQGKHAEAETINRQTLELKEEVLGKTHPSTLTTMSNLARVLDSQGKHAEAETINRQTLELMEEVLGKTHPSTLTTMGNLAGVLDRQGKYAEAETINRQTLELMEEVLGKTHPSTLTTMSNLAGVLDSQGKYAEAETINRQTLELMEEVLGKTHPSTLTTMSNLARVLNSQGKHAEAETINRQTLELKEEVLGKTHPSTLTTMSNLARVLDSQGKHAEAETINRQTLELMEEVLGKTHPSTLTTMGNLAGVLNRQGKHAEAETINRQTLELKEEVLGKTHPSTLTTMGNLAGVLNRQGKHAEAETINRQTLELMEEVLGKTHPSTLTTMGNLAGVLNRQGKHAEAETINRQTLKLKEEVLGKTHPDTLDSFYGLAYLLQKKKEYTEAAILYQRACTGYKSVLGSEHPTTMACVSNYSAMLDIIREGGSSS